VAVVVGVAVAVAVRVAVTVAVRVAVTVAVRVAVAVAVRVVGAAVVVVDSSSPCPSPEPSAWVDTLVTDGVVVTTVVAFVEPCA